MHHFTLCTFSTYMKRETLKKCYITKKKLRIFSHTCAEFFSETKIMRQEKNDKLSRKKYFSKKKEFYSALECTDLKNKI